MKNLFIASSYLVLLCLLFSCQGQKKAPKQPEILKNSMIELLGEQFVEHINQDSSLVLCFSTNSSSHPIITKFAVCDVNFQQIIYQSSVRDGYVKWYNETKLLIKDQPGIEKVNASQHIFLIDLKTKTKTAYNPRNNE